MSTNTLMEFNEIKKKWGEYAVTESAKERINAAAPILNEDELRKEFGIRTKREILWTDLGFRRLPRYTRPRK